MGHNLQVHVPIEGNKNNRHSQLIKGPLTRVHAVYSHAGKANDAYLQLKTPVYILAVLSAATDKWTKDMDISKHSYGSSAAMFSQPTVSRSWSPSMCAESSDGICVNLHHCLLCEHERWAATLRLADGLLGWLCEGYTPLSNCISLCSW